MRTIRNWLVVNAVGEMKIRTRRPSTLCYDEVAIPVVVHMPDGWGDIVNDQIDVHMPEPPTFEPVDGDAIIVGEPPEQEQL